VIEAGGKDPTSSKEKGLVHCRSVIQPGGQVRMIQDLPDKSEWSHGKEGRG